MAKIKISRGNKETLPSEKNDGQIYVCLNDGTVYTDFLNQDNMLERKLLSGETIIDQKTDSLKKIWYGTKNEYDQILNKNSSTIYFISDSNEINNIPGLSEKLYAIDNSISDLEVALGIINTSLDEING